MLMTGLFHLGIAEVFVPSTGANVWCVETETVVRIAIGLWNEMHIEPEFAYKVVEEVGSPVGPPAWYACG